MTNPSTSPAAISIQDLARLLELEAPEGVELKISGVSTVEAASPQEITFLANDRYAARLKDSRAGAVLVPEDFDGAAPMTVLRSASPRLALVKLVAYFHPAGRRPSGVHPTAVVPDSCTLGAHVYLGPYAVLGENVQLADGVVVHAHAVLYDDVHVGAGTEIHSHVSIREGTRIGANVIIHNGTVIGADGFGFEPDAEGRLVKVPQVGTVQIDDDVELQANVCVDRAALGVTRIGRGTKLDNFAQVAHGCTIGEDTVVCGQVGLSGSTHIGNHAMLGGQSGFAGHTRVGDGTKVAAQSGVMSDLEAGKIYAGTPAGEIGKMMRAAGLIPKLPDLYKRLRKLEKALQAQQPDS